MEWGVSHAATAGFAFILGVGVGLLARNSRANSAAPSSYKSTDEDFIPIEVPRQVAIDVMIAERRELLHSSLALTKALATFSVAGMAASAALFATTRAAHIVIYPAFMAFFLAFIATLFPYFDHSKAALKQFARSFQTLIKSNEEQVTLPLILPELKFSGHNLCMYSLMIGAALIALSIVIPVKCSLSTRDNTGLFGTYGEKFCLSLRVLAQ
jgi:small-conductance mechanosensitive channel